jgi:hypothetical protein
MIRRTRGTLILGAIVVAGAVAGCTGGAGATPGPSLPPALEGAALQASVADANTAAAVTDGDLWPSCWGDDDAIYAAHGDGMGFGTEFFDAAVNRIDGEVDDLEGETLAGGDAIGQVWSGEGFTRKPTGMACVDGALYLAVQDLRLDFNEAPAATIAVSHDKGATWEWDRSAPMFAEHVFTTIMFLDFGKDAEHRPDGWVYAYGLDGNWRDSFDDSVPDPQDLYLARVPDDSVQDRSTWEFFTGSAGGEAEWSADIDARAPVLTDERRQYPSASGGEGGTVGTADLSVISQGGIVYDEPLDTYLYTSWTELTYEFYSAPSPWGPWSLFLSKDYGPYPWSDESYGGYGATIPSKFISDDGRSMWLQSNVCPCAPAGMSAYYFGLRELHLAPVAS